MRIETLSDDEDVDITDDLSDEGSQTDQPPEMGGGQEGVEEQDSQGEASQGEASHSPQSPPTPPSPKASPPRLAEASAYGGTLEVDSGPSSAVQFDPSVSEEEGKTDLESASLGRTPQEEEEKHYDTGNVYFLSPSLVEEKWIQLF